MWTYRATIVVAYKPRSISLHVLLHITCLNPADTHFYTLLQTSITSQTVQIAPLLLHISLSSITAGRELIPSLVLPHSAFTLEILCEVLHIPTHIPEQLGRLTTTAYWSTKGQLLHLSELDPPWSSEIILIFIKTKHYAVKPLHSLELMINLLISCLLKPLWTSKAIKTQATDCIQELLPANLSITEFMFFPLDIVNSHCCEFKLMCWWSGVIFLFVLLVMVVCLFFSSSHSYFKHRTIQST